MQNTIKQESPLASRLRPQTLDEVVGQQHIIGKDKLLYRAIQADKLSSIIFYGPPGTGKTTLIAGLVGALKDLGIKPVLLAPTGRAAKVLAQYAQEKALTIHKRIYRQRTNADYESKFSLNINPERGAVFIVDEASMLSDNTQGGAVFGSGSLLSDLVEYVRSGRGCRLVLVGDSAQLPPVGADFSPALDPVSMDAYGGIVYGTMDEVVRQEAQSGILFNATLVRCMLENGLYEIPRFEMDFPDIEAVVGGEFLEKLQDCYARYGRDETIVITRSNKRANRYNAGIRGMVQFKEESLVKGDRLMIVKNCYQFVEDIPGLDYIANGDIAKLVSISGYEERYGLHFADAVLDFPDYDDATVRAKVCLDTLQSESATLTYEQQNALYQGVSADYADRGTKKRIWQAVREDKYFNALQLKYAEAVTCHKSQGGQWDCVFIDCPFWLPEQSVDDLKWLYTAITRAVKKVYLVNFKDSFFKLS